MVITIYESPSDDVYYNQAVEEFLVNRHYSDDEVILYFWQNEKSVIVGKNQCASIECNMKFAKENDIKIARRLSGGGAVYHDKGNLNYTFFSSNNVFSKELFLSIITKAMSCTGILVNHSGRNDIEIDGRKVSGTAYYEGRINSFLHGCIMVDVDISILENVLTVDNSKTFSKGIKSVKTRVANLKEYNQDITIKKIKDCIIDAAKWKLSTGIEDACINSTDELNIPGNIIAKYRSDKWIYKKEMPASFLMTRRFGWGGCTLAIDMGDKSVINVDIYTDSLETELFDKVSVMLKDCHLRKTETVSRLEKMKGGSNDEIIADIQKMLMEDMDIDG